MKRLLPWILVLIMITVFFGTIYGVVQQAQRNDANWPQIQMAQDAAVKLEDKSLSASSLISNEVDINRSLSPFIVAYNEDGKPVAGSGYIDGKLPTIDKSVLESAKGKDYNAVTWTPNHTRMAAVVVASKNYYVLSARSLKEVEKNENTTLLISVIGWLVSVLLLGVLFAVNIRLSKTA